MSDNLDHQPALKADFIGRGAEGKTGKPAGRGACCLGWRRVAAGLAFCAGILAAGAAQEAHYGFAYDEHRLTLSAAGTETQIAGPFYYEQAWDTTRLVGCPPFFIREQDPALEMDRWDALYPLVGYTRYGQESRWHIFQFFSFAGGTVQEEQLNKRFTLFPFYFQQRSPIPEENYTAVFPFYGHLKHRLLRDEMNFVMWPGYVQTRKKDVVTDNYLAPFFHVRHGDQLSGWQFWPLVGHEHRDYFTRTNQFDLVEEIGGHDKTFALWPIYGNETTGMGTTNLSRQFSVLPFYNSLRSPARDYTGYLWPFGYSYAVDREKQYTEWTALWPVVDFARGEGKTINRVLPFFSEARTATEESDSYLWPVYRYSHVHSEPLDRERVRILFYLYSDIKERNSLTSQSRRQTDLWPLFTQRRDLDGKQRLQVLALLEPWLVGNEKIERAYSPLWALWREEKNPQSGLRTESFLWNLYRGEVSKERKMYSLFFGLFQYESTADGARWRALFLNGGRRAANSRQTGK